MKETRMKKLLSVALVLALAVTSLLSGCAAQKETAAPAAIEDGEFTIAFCTWIGYAPLYIAREKGIFTQYGINPTLTINEDESTYAAAMFSDSIQGLGQVLDREIISFSSGTPETVLLAMDESSGGDGVIASAEIASVSDLAGKSVGLDTSSTAYFFFLTVLDKAGMTKDDVTIVDMDSDSTGPAFIAGEIDAAVTWEPFLSNAGEREGGHLLVDSSDYPGTIVDVLTVRQDMSNEAKRALANAWYDAVDYLKANPDEGMQIMSEGLELDLEEIKAEMAGVTFYDRARNAEFIDKSAENNIYEVIDRAAQFWVNEGIIKESVDTNAFVSAAYFG